MTDCGVCITGDWDGDTVGYRCVIVKAGQDWECSECGGKIPRRSMYELASGFHAEDGNSHWNVKTCLVCAEIANAFMCEGRWHGSSLWEDFPFGSLNTSCFERLRTVEAKTELRRRWQEWKFSDENRDRAKLDAEIARQAQG
jgi:hypothetical protein